MIVIREGALEAEIGALEAEIGALEAEIGALGAEIGALEAEIDADLGPDRTEKEMTADAGTEVTPDIDGINHGQEDVSKNEREEVDIVVEVHEIVKAAAVHMSDDAVGVLEREGRVGVRENERPVEVHGIGRPAEKGREVPETERHQAALPPKKSA